MLFNIFVWLLTLKKLKVTNAEYIWLKNSSDLPRHCHLLSQQKHFLKHELHINDIVVLDEYCILFCRTITSSRNQFFSCVLIVRVLKWRKFLKCLKLKLFIFTLLSTVYFFEDPGKNYAQEAILRKPLWLGPERGPQQFVSSRANPHVSTVYKNTTVSKLLRKRQQQSQPRLAE